METDILLIISLIFCLIAVMSANRMITFPIEKIGIPLYWKDVKWTWFVYRNMKRAKILDKEHLIINGYVIVFYKSWLWNVYIGNSPEEIKYKYSIGGQSNKADYLTWWQKLLGKKIEKWYLKNVSHSFTLNEIGDKCQKWLEEEISKDPNDQFSNREKYWMHEAYTAGFNEAIKTIIK